MGICKRRTQILNLSQKIILCCCLLLYGRILETNHYPTTVKVQPRDLTEITTYCACLVISLSSPRCVQMSVLFHFRKYCYYYCYSKHLRKLPNAITFYYTLSHRAPSSYSHCHRVSILYYMS